MELNSMPFCQKKLHVCLDMHLESYSYEQGRLLDPNRCRWICSSQPRATTDEECTLPFVMSKGGAKF